MNNALKTYCETQTLKEEQLEIQRAILVTLISQFNKEVKDTKIPPIPIVDDEESKKTITVSIVTAGYGILKEMGYESLAYDKVDWINKSSKQTAHLKSDNNGNYIISFD